MIMEVYFKDTYGNRVGYISGEDIKDTYGNRVGYINGNDIKDSAGNRVGYLNGNDFKDTYGDRVGYINGGDIKDTYGERVGYAEGSASNIEMCAAGLLLFNLKAVSTPRATTYSRPSYSGSDDGGGFAIVALILLGIWKIIKKIFFLFVWHFGDGGFDFKGESTRSEWWKKCLLGLLAVFLGFLIVGGLATGFLSKVPAVIPVLIIFIALCVLFVPFVAVSVRRMHDLGKSGWWILVPIYGLILCGFVAGKN